MTGLGEHELAAAYALDALESDESRAFEAHLRDCTVCAEELPSLRAAAAALAYAVESPVTPPGLSANLLGSRRSRPRLAPVVSLRRRGALPVVSALAAGAAAAGIALALWPSGRSPERPVVVPIEGRAGSLVVTRGGAFLVVSSLPPAPTGKTYEAWVVLEGRPLPAGTFPGAGPGAVVALRRPVPRGARVAVSLEPRGGSRMPTGPLLFRTETA